MTLYNFNTTNGMAFDMSEVYRWSLESDIDIDFGLTWSPLYGTNINT